MLSRRTFLLPFLIAGVMALGGMAPAWAGSKITYNIGGIAIGGYDAVAYFTENKPVRGSEDHALMWAGATWYFASAANMATFEANPRAYAPQFGGYCAYAMAKGSLAPSVPEAFTIHDGKLYLNYSLDVRGLWRKDIDANIAAGKENWPRLAHP